MKFDINGYTLVRTCSACPEQYDVYNGKKQVGYIRLRHGIFRVDYLDCMQETLLCENDVNGDGMFYDDERPKYLLMAIEVIDKRIKLPPHQKSVKFAQRVWRKIKRQISGYKVRRNLKKLKQRK